MYLDVSSLEETIYNTDTLSDLSSGFYHLIFLEILVNIMIYKAIKKKDKKIASLQEDKDNENS
ncbi:MAG: hypothetical protein ACK5G7_04185 [Erysipelotrichaceae bacterium]